MKIGLLSFHNAANYGAAMQAYGLQAFLEKNGYDCEYLDYVNWSRKICYSMSAQVNQSLKKGSFVQACKYVVGSPFMEFRKYRFKQFYKKYLNVSQQKFTTAEEAKVWEPHYDKFIEGSDQVWCPVNNECDTAFLLSFIKNENKKMSYSSCFGKDVLPDELKEEYAECLKKIKHLSTREQFGVDMIKKLTGKDATLVMDPVFLLTAEDWEKMILCKNNEEYIFAYTNTTSQLPMFLKQTNYRLDGKRIYKLSLQTSPSDFVNSKVNVMYTMAPAAFLQSIHYAEFVVTASFHCLAFSILFHKPFAVMLSGNGGKTGRLSTLLEHFGLTDRVVIEKTTLADLQKLIDWEYVDRVLEDKRKESIEYLLSSLSSAIVGVILWVNVERLWISYHNPNLNVADLVREGRAVA